MPIRWFNNSEVAGARLQRVVLTIPILHALIFSFVVGSTLQFTIFNSFAFMTEVYFTDPPKPPEDHSFRTPFPIGHVAFFPAAAFVMLAVLGNLIRSLSVNGKLGIIPVVFISMGVFGFTYYALVFPYAALAVYILEPDDLIFRLFLLSFLHIGISFGVPFSAALILAIESKIPSLWNVDHVGLVWRAFSIVTVLCVVAGWQLIYWPLWHELA